MQRRYIDQYGNSGPLDNPDYEVDIRNMAKDNVSKRRHYTVCVIEFPTDDEWWDITPHSTIWKFEYNERDANNNLIPTLY